MTRQKNSDRALRVKSTGGRKLQYEISFFQDITGIKKCFMEFLMNAQTISIRKFHHFRYEFCYHFRYHHVYLTCLVLQIIHVQFL